MAGLLFEVEMSKNGTPLRREARFQVKCTKHIMRGPLFEVQMLKNGTPLWREARFQIKIETFP